jgi:hypothetical protein
MFTLLFDVTKTCQGIVPVLLKRTGSARALWQQRLVKAGWNDSPKKMNQLFRTDSGGFGAVAQHDFWAHHPHQVTIWRR